MSVLFKFLIPTLNRFFFVDQAEQLGRPSLEDALRRTTAGMNIVFVFSVFTNFHELLNFLLLVTVEKVGRHAQLRD